MKKMLSASLLFLFVLSTQAQSLSLDDLITLRNSDIGIVNDFLLNKGWVFSRSKGETEDGSSRATWSYGESDWDSSAYGWLSINTQDSITYLTYQVSNNAAYTKIKTKIESYAMKLIDTRIREDYIFTVYEGKNYTVRIGISSKNYIIQLFRKADFHLKYPKHD